MNTINENKINRTSQPGFYNPGKTKKLFNQPGTGKWLRLTQRPIGQLRRSVRQMALEKYIQPGDRVLQIGAAANRFTRILADLGARIVVVDISPAQLELNRRYAERFDYELAVVDRLALDVRDMYVFQDGTFDAALCIGQDLTPILDARTEAKKEILRVLRPGGAAILGHLSLRKLRPTDNPEA